MAAAILVPPKLVSHVVLDIFPQKVEPGADNRRDLCTIRAHRLQGVVILLDTGHTSLLLASIYWPPPMQSFVSSVRVATSNWPGQNLTFVTLALLHLLLELIFSEDL